MKSLYKITVLLLAMIIAMSSLDGCSFTNQKEQTRPLLTLPDQRLKSLPKSTKLSICFPLTAS